MVVKQHEELECNIITIEQMKAMSKQELACHIKPGRLFCA